jgi:acetaldehyde dehydrogenase
VAEPPVPVAIIGSGNIGTDLLMKIDRRSRGLRVVAMAGIDPDSEGLARARAMGVAVTHQGVAGLMGLDEFRDVRLVYDATSAASHVANAEALAGRDVQIVDLTPAALGPFVVPVVNLDHHASAPDLNMVSCGGQATIPIVAAVSRVTPVRYAEIVASIASRSAGPGTRANIDEFTETTARGIEQVGGAERGKAIIILNPAEPPLIMRDTVYCMVEDGADERRISESVREMVAEVQRYVPGYRLKQEVQFDSVSVPGNGTGPVRGTRVSVLLEVEGAGDFLPAYAGNLDIMTSAALASGERLMASAA